MAIRVKLTDLKDIRKELDEAEVRTLLTAAQEAPSWANMGPTKSPTVR